MLKKITTVICCLVLASCATSKIRIVPPVKGLVTQVGPNDGIVVFQLADATPKTWYPINYVTIAPKNVYEDKKNQFLRLQAIDEQARSSSTYIAVVPANEYTFSSLLSYHVFGDRYYSRFFNANIATGTFTVEPGKVTDLGTIALTVYKSGDDFFSRLIQSSSEKHGIDILKYRQFWLTERVDNVDSPLGWNEDGQEEERFDMYSQAIQNPITFDRPFHDSHTGHVTFPSRLGTLLTRRDFGDWEVQALESDIDIVSYSVNKEGEQLAIGESDKIFYRKSSSVEWQEISPPRGNGELAYISFSKYGKIYVARKVKTSISLYSTEDIASNDWSHVTNIESVLDFGETFAMFGKVGGDDRSEKQQDFIHSDDYLYVKVNDDLFRFSFKDEAVKRLDPDISLKAVTFNHNVLMAFGRSFMRNHFMRSLNHGDTWVSVKGSMAGSGTAPKFWGLPIFLSSTEGYSVHAPKRTSKHKEMDDYRSTKKSRKIQKTEKAEENKEREKPYLIKTTDGGASWEKVNGDSLPEGCYSLVDISSDLSLSLNCYISGEFYLSDAAFFRVVVA